MVKETGQAIEFICRATQGTHPLGIFYGESPLEYSFTLVLLEVTLIVLITRILAFLLKPLKQPRIVSDILVTSLSLSFLYKQILEIRKNYPEFYPKIQSK